MMKNGIMGIFDAASVSTSSTVLSICDTMEMPLMTARWDPDQRRQACMVNVHPHPSVLVKVFVDLVREKGWKTFTILYESGSWLPRMADLLKYYDRDGHTITVRELDLGLNGIYRPVLRRVKKSGETNMILDCSIEKLPEVLIQAQQVGLMSDQHQFIITSLDLHTIDLEPFQHGGTNITGVRIVDPDDPVVNFTIRNWMLHEERRGKVLPESLMAKNLRSDAALLYDSVILFAVGLKQLNKSLTITSRPLECFMYDDVWEKGSNLITYMKLNQAIGLTRTIKFDHEGFRKDFLLDVVELGSAGLVKIGSWNSTEGLNITREYETPLEYGDDFSLRNKSFIVLTAISPPYGMLKDSSVKLNGNDRFEGFGIELIDELSKMLGFNYTFHIQEDGVYGSLNRQTGEWNGMMKELLEYRADLAITDLTVTSDRDSAVDFTMPFMNLGIQILYKKPRREPPSLFSFMSPFSKEVWLYLGAAYVGVSLLFFMLGRLSPAEWENPFPCIEEPALLYNQFSLKNSFWFTIGSLLQQGSEIAPRAASTRMVASIWWFFTLIMVSSYTANLAAFLTVESVSSPINSAEDLANQKTIKYGAKRDGSTISFFKDAEYPTYQKMYQYMMDNPDMLTSSNPEGVARVKNENYAFLMESTSIDYMAERECDITAVGGLLDDKGYAIAMRKFSPYRDALSTAVLQLQEQGKLAAMKIKWWKEKRGGGACSSGAMDKDKADELGLPNVGGVFAVLVLGSIGAFVVNVFEGLTDAMRRARKHNVSFKEEVKADFRFVLKCSGKTKPVRHRSSSSNSRSDSDMEADSIESIEYHSPKGNVRDRLNALPYGFSVDNDKLRN
ncbi:glutamate receptor ionotropic, kainate 3-like [Ctenocephalides felis]|uniref:glutamate receptor ionotropic, kainate 3-like n=1 Tax=Ctenocephalides felis TaxID=7515 RepID=UPI000E6E30D6|nr:glutamate receptor ionotropic, kainate 3-like [Ctenocephalides felis]